MYVLGFGENYNKEFLEEITMYRWFTHVSFDPRG